MATCILQGAVLRWAATLVKDGRAGCCIEAAICAASSGVLDKSADAREAGSALMLTLLQVALASEPTVLFDYLIQELR